MPDRYEIKGKIARGGIGAIYRAYDTVMGREVAIKRLLPIEETHLNESAGESLQREAAALAKFQHPNVVSIYAFEEDDDGRFVVMEFVDGETLKETATKAALPVTDFIELTLQILDPLIAARDLNLLHRDIKPANIMMAWLATGKFQVKMLDFGLAKFSQKPSTQTLDQTGSFLGSIDYLAPEQLDLQKLDQRTDLYSLGCVLYYCLTQTPPFEGKNAAQTMRNHLTHQVAPIDELRPDLPASLGAWLMRLISRYPNQRPDDARAALTEFQAAVAASQREVDRSVPMAKVADPDPLAVAIVEDEPTGGAPPAEDKTARRTGPRMVSGEPKPKAQPQLLVPGQPSGGSRPAVMVGGRPARSTGSRSSRGSISRSSSRAKPSKEAATSPGLVVLIVITVVAILGLIFFLSTRDEGETRGSEDGGGSNLELSEIPEGLESRPGEPSPGSKAKGGTVSRPAKGTKPLPRNPEANAKTKSPRLPVEAGLVGHYAASDFAFGDDLRHEAKPGDQVLAWANLAPRSNADHLLAFQAGKRGATPVLKQVSPGQHAELNGPHRVLEFPKDSALEARGRAQISNRFGDDGFTCVLVMRPGPEKVPVLRLQTPELNPASALSIVPRGFSGMVRESNAWKSVPVNASHDSFAIVSLTWRAEEKRHQVHVRLPGGESIASKPMTTTVDRMALDGYRLGHLPSADEAQGPGRGAAVRVAEFVIYGEPLPESDRRELEDHLHRRYFSPK